MGIVRRVREHIGPVTKEQDVDDEMFETLNEKTWKRMIVFRLTNWILFAFSLLLFVLAVVGFFSTDKSYLVYSGLLSLLLMLSSVSGDLCFRWKQRLLLITSIVSNVLWLTFFFVLIFVYSLAVTDQTHVEYKKDVVFHVVTAIAATASLVLLFLHLESLYLLLKQKDAYFLQRFFSSCCRKSGGRRQEDGEQGSEGETGSGVAA